MSTPRNKPGTGWKVIDQVPEARVGPNNTLAEGVTVHFQTQYGANGNVWLPRLTYSPDTARTAITELAATMDTVHNLTG